MLCASRRWVNELAVPRARAARARCVCNGGTSAPRRREPGARGGSRSDSACHRRRACTKGRGSKRRSASARARPNLNLKMHFKVIMVRAGGRSQVRRGELSEGLFDLEEGEATAGGVVVGVLGVEEADLVEALTRAVDGAEHQARPAGVTGRATPAGPRHVPGVAPAARAANDGRARTTETGARIVEPREQPGADLTNFFHLTQRFGHEPGSVQAACQGVCKIRIPVWSQIAHGRPYLGRAEMDRNRDASRWLPASLETGLESASRAHAEHLVNGEHRS